MKPLRVAALAALFVAVRLDAQTTAFTGFTLIDGTGKAPVANAALIVRNGKVIAVGAASAVKVPADAKRVALDGKFVMPGLVNAHGHVNQPADLNTYAAYGVTTVFSLGGEPPEVFAARASQDNADLKRARVFVAGPVLTPSSPAEATQMVADDVNRHVDIVKIRVDDNLGTTQKMAPDVSRAVITEAHRRGLRVATHLFYLADAKFLLAAGSDFVAHSIRDADVDADVIAQLKSRDVCVSPTLMREVSTFVYESTPEWFSDPLFLSHANMVWVDERKAPARQAAMKASASAQRYKVALEQASKNLKMLSDAGVRIAMGTDTGPDGRFQGYFELMELELMAKAGLTSQQVILAATRDAARCMRIDREIGTLESGKYADFIALDANPLDNVSNVRKISAVYISGNKVDR
jgi:imidazolonepropionase-like amidohydrolase